MDNKFSIIIPCYNAQSTIEQCLGSVFKLNKTFDFEVIIIDDGSKDRTLEIAQQYPCKIIQLEGNRGAAYARNRGAQQATGDLLLFIDSDVILPENTLSLIKDCYKRTSSDGVVGLFSSFNPFQDFFSQYKSMYCHFKYQKISSGSALNTAITSIKKQIFDQLCGFNEKMAAAEDNELGDRLFRNGFKICVNQQLEVIHLKNFSLLSLLKNDYRKSISLAYLFFYNLKNGKLSVKKEFTDISIRMMLNVPIVYGSLLIMLLSAIFKSWLFCIGAMFLLTIFLINNMAFWKYLFQKKGLVFTVQSILFTYIDYIAVGLGIVKGLSFYRT